MSKPPSKPFSNPKLKDALQDDTTASAAIQLYSQMILKQSDIKLDALPNLPDHQKVARDHATFWGKNIHPNMGQSTADIIGYANMFQAFHETLVKYAKDIDNPDSKKKLVEGLRLLHSNIQTKCDSVQTTIDKLNSFLTDLTKDNQNFQADYKVALVKIEGDDGEKKALSDQLDTIHSAMHKDIAMMAAGAVGIVGGVIMMAVGVLLEIPSAGTSTFLIGGGFFVFAAGAIVETFGATDYSKQIDAQKKVTEQLATVDQEMTGLKTAKSHLLNFQTAIASAITSTQTLRDSWQGLGDDLGIVIDAIDQVDPSITSDYIVDELDAANSDWKVALEKARQLQPAGKIPVKVYKDLKDAFKEMKG